MCEGLEEGWTDGRSGLDWFIYGTRGLLSLDRIYKLINIDNRRDKMVDCFTTELTDIVSVIIITHVTIDTETSSVYFSFRHCVTLRRYLNSHQLASY